MPANDLESTIKQRQPELIIVSTQLLQAAAILRDLAKKALTYNNSVSFGGLAFKKMPGLRTLVPGYFVGESPRDAVQSVSDIILSPPVSQWR